MNSLQVFSNQEFSVRTIEDDGTIWFVAKDVAKALEYPESSINQVNNLFKHVPSAWAGHKRIMVRSENGVVQERELLCVTEQGLYFFLGRSDKPKALPYQMWIAGDVVPSIRKTGSYNANNTAIPDEPLNVRARIAEVLQRLALQVTDETQKEAITRKAYEYATGEELPKKEPKAQTTTGHRYWTSSQIGKTLKWPADAVITRAKNLGITDNPANGIWDGDIWNFSKEGRQKFLELVNSGVVKIEDGYEYYENGFCRKHWSFDASRARI